ncbi:MAG: alanine racemase [Deltaproteobacteria bacterium]|nr:alanine racemase [Deltaproteobacteria bacterium]
MPLSYPQLRELLSAERLPAVVVDLDALDRNLDRVLALVRPSGVPLRVASKSVRVVAVLRRLLERGDGLLRGLLCFAVEEAEFLAGEGFDDLLVAYPAWQRLDLRRVAKLTGDGVRIALMCDCRAAIDRVSAVADAHRVTIPVVLCVDMSLRLARGRVFLGVRRSPLFAPEQVVELARYAESRPGVKLHGLMGYEAQVAGVGDESPFEPWLNPVKALIRRKSVTEVAARRGAMVAALREAGFSLELVNGGGTGSLDSTTACPEVTEVTAGSAFFKPHLFDYYRNPHVKQLQPACFFALEVTRKPADDLVTCLGGGYVASGPAGADKVPLPWLPAGLELLRDEMCGEVQTPLRVPRGVELGLGDPVIFRHAKAGELNERFNEVLLVQDGAIVRVVSDLCCARRGNERDV